MRDYKYGDLYFDTQHDNQMKIDVVGTGIVIDNSMIEMEAFELDETLCSESELKFGRCEANCVKFTARNLPGSINGKTINVTETIDGNTDEPFPYGKYKVYSDVPTSDRTKREITAYDAMYDIINADVKQWYAGLSFPMTLRKFRDSFFTYLGIIQKETTLVNDGMTVNKTLITESSSDSNMTEVDSISGKTVVEAICEINGVFGNINRDGLFEYVELKPIINPLYPANDLYPRNDLFPREPNTISMSGHYITFDYEDFQTKKVTQLEIRPSDNTVGEKVGEAGNNYVISGNFLVSDKSGAELNGIAQNVLEVIGKVSYTPIKSSSCVGNPCLELGDPIRFNTSREIVESYILQRTLTGIQAKRDSIESHGVEFYPVNNNGIKKRVEDVENRADSLEQTADEIQEDVEEFKSETNVRFETTDNQILAEVTRAMGVEGSLSSNISLNADAITAEVQRAMGVEGTISANLSLKIDKTDDGQIISLINGSANKIQFNATNMFTVESPNFSIDSSGNVDMTGKINATSGQIGNFGITDKGLEWGGWSWNGSDYEWKSYGTKIWANTIATSVIYPTDSSTELFLGDYLNINDLQKNVTIDGKTIYLNGDSVLVNNKAVSVEGHTHSSVDRAEKCGSSSYYVKVSSNNNFIPSNTSMECGTTSNPFNVGYSSNGWNKTSDKRLKKDFVLLNADRRFEDMFYLIEPTYYRLKRDDKIGHVGFIAQNIEQAMHQCNIREDEFYGFHHEYADMSEFDTHDQYVEFLNRNEGNNDTYTLCYEEFIALNTHMIQKQHAEIEELKQVNLSLLNRLSTLEMKMEVICNVSNNKNNQHKRSIQCRS